MPAGKTLAKEIEKMRTGLWLSLVAVLCVTGCVSPNLSGGGGLDFSLSASPGSQAVTAGLGTNFLITVNQTSAQGPVVQLSVSGVPAGVSAQFVNGSLTSAGTVSLSILTSPTTPPGTSKLTITGSDTTGTQTVGVMLTVNSPPPPPNFTVTATPGTQATLVGGSVSYGVNVTASGNPTVNLSVSNVPAGATAGFDNSSVTGTGGATLTVSTTASIATGTYTLTITGSDSSGTQSIQVNLQVASTDFSLSTSLVPSVVNAGATVPGTVTVAAVVGSPGAVNLSAPGGTPSGFHVSFGSAAVTAGSSTTLSIAIDPSVTPADYQFEIQGEDGSGTQSILIDLTVVPGNSTAGFFLLISPPDLALTAGDTGSYALTLLTGGGAVPSVSVDVAGLPVGASSQVVPNGAGVFTINIFTDPSESSTSSNVTITVTGPDGSQSVTVALDVTAIPCC